MMQVPSIILVVKEIERGVRRRAADLDSIWHGGGTEGMGFGTYAAKALANCIYLMLVRFGFSSAIVLPATIPNAAMFGIFRRAQGRDARVTHHMHGRDTRRKI